MALPQAEVSLQETLPAGRELRSQHRPRLRVGSRAPRLPLRKRRAGADAVSPSAWRITPPAPGSPLPFPAPSDRLGRPPPHRLVSASSSRPYAVRGWRVRGQRPSALPTRLSRPLPRPLARAAVGRCPVPAPWLAWRRVPCFPALTRAGLGAPQIAGRAGSAEVPSSPRRAAGSALRWVSVARLVPGAAQRGRGAPGWAPWG